jgi:uncharacterized protein YozE (UPF0346 family)
MLARLLSSMLIVSVFLFAGPASAQTKNRDKARAHYEAAEKAYQKAEFRKALDDYLKVLDYIERDSIPDMYFNIAQCHRQLGEVEKALFYYRLFLSKSPTSPLRPEVEKHVSALEAERQKTAKPKGKVTIITEPPGASILIDTFEGEGVGVTPKVLEVEIGTHILVLRLANHKDITHQLVVEAEKMVVVQHTLIPASGAAPVKTEDAKSLLTQDDTKKPPVTADPVPPQAPKAVPFYGRWWFWTGVGATAVFAIATGYFGMETLSLKDKWNETGESKYKNDGEKARLFTDLFLGATVISAGLTIWGALSVGDGTSDLPKQPEKGSAWLLPSCGEAGCGFVFQYHF